MSNKRGVCMDAGAFSQHQVASANKKSRNDSIVLVNIGDLITFNGSDEEPGWKLGVACNITTRSVDSADFKCFSHL
jgi:hypothetical protein